MNKSYYVYIVASKKNGVLYIGVTSDLQNRMNQHKNEAIQGFTSKYIIHKLVYYEQTEDVNSAISREKVLKKWNRSWKIELIEKDNPTWKDLSEDWYL
jgi:putative endonuclease